MKLTNLSLSILVALGLIACGGSDDNSNAAADNNNAGHQQGGKGGDGSKPEDGNKPGDKTEQTKTDENKSGLDPNRVSPDLKVPANLENIVNSRKKAFIDRTFSDKALGYTNSSTTYDRKASTDPANIKFTSTYNFLEENDVFAAKDQGFYKAKVGGAIQTGEFVDNKNNNAWAKGEDGKYYRVWAKAVQGALDKYTDETPYEIVYTNGTAKDDFGTNWDKIKQSDVVFIANATNGDNGGAPGNNIISLGKDIATSYLPSKSDVILSTVSALGTKYDAYGTGQELDFGKMAVKREIQLEPVTGTYVVKNTKNDADATNDKIVSRDIKLGHIKAYNLPYSVAYVTIDQDKKNAKDIFALGTPDRVSGLQTVSLPKDGRAFYKGKSFNATVEGDIELVADFFAERAGITGTVSNRKDVIKNANLPEVTLNLVPLTDNNGRDVTSGTSTASGDAKITNWDVQFYGLEAQEAAGRLTGPGGYVEVFNSQRGVLTNKSNDASTN